MSFSDFTKLCEAANESLPPILQVRAHELWPDPAKPFLQFDTASALVSHCMDKLGQSAPSQMRRERAVEASEERAMGIGLSEKRQRDARFRHVFSRLALQLSSGLGYKRPPPTALTLVQSQAFEKDISSDPTNFCSLVSHLVQCIQNPLSIVKPNSSSSVPRESKPLRSSKLQQSDVDADVLSAAAASALQSRDPQQFRGLSSKSGSGDGSVSHQRPASPASVRSHSLNRSLSNSALKDRPLSASRLRTATSTMSLETNTKAPTSLSTPSHRTQTDVTKSKGKIITTKSSAPAAAIDVAAADSDQEMRVSELNDARQDDEYSVALSDDSLVERWRRPVSASSATSSVIKDFVPASLVRPGSAGALAAATALLQHRSSLTAGGGGTMSVSNLSRTNARSTSAQLNSESASVSELIHELNVERSARQKCENELKEFRSLFHQLLQSNRGADESSDAGDMNRQAVLRSQLWQQSRQLAMVQNTVDARLPDAALQDALRAVQNARAALDASLQTIKVEKDVSLAMLTTDALTANRNASAQSAPITALSKADKALLSAADALSATQQRIVSLQHTRDASPFGSMPPPSWLRASPLAQLISAQSAATVSISGNLSSTLAYQEVADGPRSPTAHESVSTRSPIPSTSTMSNSSPHQATQRLHHVAAVASWNRLDDALSSILMPLSQLCESVRAACDESNLIQQSPVSVNCSSIDIPQLLGGVRRAAAEVGAVCALLPAVHPAAIQSKAVGVTADSDKQRHLHAHDEASFPMSALLFEAFEVVNSSKPPANRLRDVTSLLHRMQRLDVASALSRKLVEAELSAARSAKRQAVSSMDAWVSELVNVVHHIDSSLESLRQTARLLQDALGAFAAAQHRVNTAGPSMAVAAQADRQRATVALLALLQEALPTVLSAFAQGSDSVWSQHINRLQDVAASVRHRASEFEIKCSSTQRE